MVIAIIQARVGSTRFPAKVLKTIEGKTLLELYVNRVKPSRKIDKIVIATTENPADDAIYKLAQRIQVECFRGSENNLLDRYYQCAKKFAADTVVRLTSDDVFVDHEVIDRGIELFEKDGFDFITNHFKPTYPEGLDVEIYSFEALERSWLNAEMLSETEHVFPYIQNHQGEFRVLNFTQEIDRSGYRWTIDYEKDLEMAKKVYSYLYAKNPIFLQEEIIKLLEARPEIAAINVDIDRKEGVNKAKESDMTVSWERDL